MRRWPIVLAASLGLLVLVALVLWSGVDTVRDGVGAVGTGLALIVLVRLAALTLAGFGWRILMGADHGVVGWAGYAGLRIVREGINCLLPVAQVGGDLVGGRLLARLGVPAGAAAAGILVDILIQAATQGLFALCGLAVLAAIAGDSPAVREAAGGLLVAGPLLGGFFLAQRLGLFALVDRGGALIARHWPGLAPRTPLSLQPALRRLYGDWRSVAIGSLVHFLAWTLGAIEIRLALGRMGYEQSWARCIVLESLGQAVRSAGFAVPASVGIQEGGFVALGALFGIPVGSAVALSLVKRVPDVVLGIPGLVGWHFLELRASRSASPEVAGRPDDRAP